MKTFTSAISLALSASSVLASAPSTAGTQWKNTLLLDDFTGAAGAPPSSSLWRLQTGTQYPGGPAQWGTGEVETYTANTNNVHQDGNGNLLITPIKSSSGQWTSARVETVGSSFAAPAGGKMRIESRIKSPSVTSTNGLGYWSAFWALGGTFRSNYQSWPACGEIDIMETINGAAAATNGLHCDVNPGGPCNEPDGLGSSNTCSGSACVGNYHIYELVIDRSVQPEELKYWLDRTLVATITSNQLGAAVWNETIHKGYYLILNVAMGGAYPNAVAGVTTPTSATISGQSMAVDYVAIWTT